MKYSNALKGIAIGVIVLSLVAVQIFQHMMSGWYVVGDAGLLANNVMPLSYVSGNTWRVTDTVGLPEERIVDVDLHVEVLKDVQHADDDVRSHTAMYIHGGPCAPPGQLPRHVADGLLAGGVTRVIYFHHRGCGNSSRPFPHALNTDGNPMAFMGVLERTLGVRQVLLDIERVRRTFVQEGHRIVVVGHSFGALLASLYVADFAQHVSSLMLIAPAPLLVFPMPPEFDGLAKIRSLLPEHRLGAYDEWLSHMMDFSPASFAHATESSLSETFSRFLTFWVEAVANKESASPDDMLERLSGDVPLVGGWASKATYLSLGMYHDYTRAIGALDADVSGHVDVLVLHGADDLQSKEASATYAHAFEHVARSLRFHVVPKAGHFPFDENFDDFLRETRNFLKKTVLV